MAKRRRKSLAGTGEQHMVSANAAANRSFKAFKASERAAKAGDCNEALDLFEKGALAAGALEANNEWASTRIGTGSTEGMALFAKTAIKACMRRK